ncbi:hypothetical protein Q7M_1169 (plasmid) [Borrelia crocidurae str. Achema]|uniref:Variable large protein n=1 Tax=Borrelia crocidurae (strain Achema) TaxID=1155096 RepID=I0FFB1_BORCA|nr:hypothetical protein Q7M_1169 [Borrelia crocidurae str. Achema]
MVENKLDKIIAGAKEANEAIGNAGDIDNLVKGIKGIVGVVLKEGNAEAGDDKNAENLSSRNNDGAGKLFTNFADADAKKVVEGAE